MYLALRVGGPRQETLPGCWRMVAADQVISDCNHAARASPALIKKMVVCASVTVVEFLDAVWVSIAKTVNRLVYISDDTKRARFREVVDEYLLRLIQILILVNEYMVERINCGTCRVVANEVQGLGQVRQ
jgi:hypothetical protein